MEQLCLFLDESKAGMTFAELTEFYFAHYAEQRLKASTRENYRYIADRFLLPAFGTRPLSEFNNLMMTQWFSELPASPSYCKNIFTVLRSLFTVAMYSGFVESHPCDYVLLPRTTIDAEERKPRLTEENAKELFCMTEEFSWFTAVVRFLLLTGMRSGEAFGLRWEDVDFDDRFISIRRTLVYADGKRFLDKPKTRNSIRTIGMNEEVEALLRRVQKEQEIWQMHCESGTGSGSAFPHPEMVFTTTKGNFIDHNYAERKFKKFVAGTAFEDATLHSLRHANATLMLASGVDLKVVSTLLGHSSIATTANLYTEVLDRTKAEAAKSVMLKLEE